MSLLLLVSPAPAFAAADYRYAAIPDCPSARPLLARANATLARDQTKPLTQADAFVALSKLGAAYHACSADYNDTNGAGEVESKLARTRLSAEAAQVMVDTCRRGVYLASIVPPEKRKTLNDAVLVFARVAFIDGLYAERFGNDDAVIERGHKAAESITSLVKQKYPKRAAEILADPTPSD